MNLLRPRTFLLAILLSTVLLGPFTTTLALQSPIKNASSYSIWTPSAVDTCSKAIHDSYSVVASDGKRYPTWHPPGDPRTGCTFGHEHGSDPRRSNIWRIAQQFFRPPIWTKTSAAGLPFGFANEQLDVFLSSKGARQEDHVGHKIEYANNVVIELAGKDGVNERRPTNVTCDYLTKIHQGTHSADAFSNNVHELFYFARCTDGTEIRLAFLASFGAAGEFTRSCGDGERGFIVDVRGVVGSPAPFPGSRNLGQREIFDAYCARKAFLVPEGKWSGNPYEFWTLDLRHLPGIKPLALGFAIFDPIRFYDPLQPSGLARTVDLCYAVEPNGDRARGGPCDWADAGPGRLNISWNDPRSPFRGQKREVYFKAPDLANSGGSSVYFTDPYGRKASTRPFKGAIAQYISKMDIDHGLKLGGNVQPTAIGANRPYGVPSTHAPN